MSFTKFKHFEEIVSIPNSGINLHFSVKSDTVPNIRKDSTVNFNTTFITDTIHTVETDTVSLLDTPKIDGVPQEQGIRGSHEGVDERFSRILMSLPFEKRHVAWRFNSNYLSNEQVHIDSSLWMNHMFYPQQHNYETFTHLGNLGSQSQYDHYFSRDNDINEFVFSRHLGVYSHKNIERIHYNVRTPFTELAYSSGGKRSEAEQTLSVLHTQNANKHLNLGVTYDFIGTKGVYRNQETRNNFISLFSSYYKGNFYAQASFQHKSFKHEDNGGIVNHEDIIGELVETEQLISVWLQDANSITKEQATSALFGYTFVNIRTNYKDEDGVRQEGFLPLISAKLLLDYNNSSRLYKDKPLNEEYYTNFYLSRNLTRDSVSLKEFYTLGVIEIAQFANIPLMPGIRGWLGFNYQDYFYVTPQDFIFSKAKTTQNTSHIGVAAFSESPYFSYQGALRIYFSGYRADDKEIIGEVTISPWRDQEMPQLIGEVEISERSPNLFYNHYYSNHFVWNNNLDKEKRFRVGGVLQAKRWDAEVGYNLIHIRDYIYFGENATPEQASNVTVTSAYAQKNLRFWGGFNFFNRVVWQANSNENALSIPSIISFSSLFFERELVSNVLTGQLGFNISYRSQFYADAFQPAIGQFHKQREKIIGNYPVVDVFANFKWHRALLFFKYEHANQGYPNNEYFATYRYPMNPEIFKFGISWIFYD